VYAALTVNERTWTCPECNSQHDRDENASVNLYNYSGDNFHHVKKPKTVKTKKDIDKAIVKKSVNKMSKMNMPKENLFGIVSQVNDQELKSDSTVGLTEWLA
jgi:hypothetical protein